MCIRDRSASVLAPDGFERRKARLAAHGREKSELPAIKPRAISCRRDEGTRGYSENAYGQGTRHARQGRVVLLHRCGRGGLPCAQTPTKLPQLSSPCVERCRAQGARQAGNAPADDGEPGTQRPSQRTHQSIEEADEAHFISRFRKLPRDLEGHESTAGIAA